MRERKNPTEKHNDLFLKLTGAQLVCCGLILGMAFGAMKLNAPLFEQMRAEFSAMNAADYDPGNFRFFDFGSAGEKQESDLPNASAQTPSNEAEPSDAALGGEKETSGSGAASAGGEDLSSGDALQSVSFGFYDAGGAVVMPVNGRITSPFGERVHPVYGTQGFHSGQDIAAPEGTPIYAAMDGEVISAGVGEKSGNYVKLSHENGMQTLYCHMSARNVDAGVTVRRGDVIGFVGHTGLATGPHLHFEVQIDGVKRDPSFLLEDAVVVS